MTGQDKPVGRRENEPTRVLVDDSVTVRKIMVGYRVAPATTREAATAPRR
jgi:hypothetical protein